MLSLNKIYENEYAKEFVADVLSQTKKVYLFGTNDLAVEFSKHIKFEGFINTLTTDAEFMGKPIVNMDDISVDSLVISCVYLGTVVVDKMLSRYSFMHLDCFTFNRIAKLPIKMVHFTGWKEEIERNFNKFADIYEKLSDVESKSIFKNLLDFYVSGDIRYLRGFEPPTDEQYFDSCLDLPAKSVFADVGGFDGFTTLKFIEHNPDYDKVYLFEPENANLSKAKMRLGEYKNIIYHNKGLSNKSAVLHFSTSGSSSMICDEGDVSIEVARLDDLIKSRVDFIKMDIEGSESEAIEGSVETIKKYHPNMAICVYHKPDDFWKIPEQILAIRNDYKLYMRHYTQGTDETVMFFIPKK